MYPHPLQRQLRSRALNFGHTMYQGKLQRTCQTVSFYEYIRYKLLLLLLQNDHSGAMWCSRDPYGQCMVSEALELVLFAAGCDSQLFGALGILGTW